VTREQKPRREIGHRERVAVGASVDTSNPAIDRHRKTGHLIR